MIKQVPDAASQSSRRFSYLVPFSRENTMSTRSHFNIALTLVTLMMVIFTITSLSARASIITPGSSIHYRADNVDGFGNPGIGSTTTLVNLASPGTHNGTIISGAGVTQNVPQIGTPYEYGVVLNDTLQTHIAANTYQIGGGVNQVTAATWEFWLRADSGVTSNRGALYGEFEASGTNVRHYLRLEGINTGTRNASYDEFPPSGGNAISDAQLFQTGEFTQIVVTKSANTLTFYQNGTQVGSTKSHSETFSGGTITQTLFGQRAAQNESFDGQFNIIRVYDSALSSAQVARNFLAETPTNIDFSMAVTAGDLTINNPSGPHVLTIDHPDAGPFTITISGSPNTGYDSGRGGGFRNVSQFAENDQLWSFAVSGLAAGFEVTDFGVGYVEADISSPNTTFTLTVDAGGPTLNTLAGIDSPGPNNQTSNDMFGTPLGNYGNAPTFNVLIDQLGSSSADVLQLNGLTITVAAIQVVPEPASIALGSMMGIALIGVAVYRSRRKQLSA